MTIGSSVFEYEDYRAYLTDWIKESGRGEKSQLAKTAQCHIAYISQVLHSKANLSLEQAHLLTQYFSHSEEESDFFLLLVEYGRAGTAALEEHFRKKIFRLQEERKQLKNRLQFKKTLEIESQAHYYSAWHYAAVHVLLTIPKFQTREQLAQRLMLPVQKISEILDFLVTRGLAVEEGGKYKSGEVSIHLGSDSPLISKHHTNWRLQALRALDQKIESHLHYSSVISIARSDATVIRKDLVTTIDQIRTRVVPSAEEEAYCYNIDFFKI